MQLSSSSKRYNTLTNFMQKFLICTTKILKNINMSIQPILQLLVVNKDGCNPFQGFTIFDIFDF